MEPRIGMFTPPLGELAILFDIRTFSGSVSVTVRIWVGMPAGRKGEMSWEIAFAKRGTVRIAILRKISCPAA
jgi:hypothetical protein